MGRVEIIPAPHLQVASYTGICRDVLAFGNKNSFFVSILLIKYEEMDEHHSF